MNEEVEEGEEYGEEKEKEAIWWKKRTRKMRRKRSMRK